MDQEKFGAFIKDIRKKHYLTQKQLADKYNVTYQAVSKWENGKNMPDITLIKQISDDFNVSLEELFEGEYKTGKKNKSLLIGIICVIVMLIGIIILINIPKHDDFKFKTLSANCENFNISGSIAYNQKKSAIYITNIKYCGGDDTKYYNHIECILYESNNDTQRKISSYKYDDDKPIKLEDFLEQVTLTADNYETLCKEYQNNNLYLSINILDEDDKILTYKVPLTLNDNC